jgi:hypothetical protein
MPHFIFRLAVTLATALSICVAVGQERWGEFHPNLESSQAVPASTPWPCVAQTPATPSPVTAPSAPAYSPVWTNGGVAPGSLESSATSAACDAGGLGCSPCRPCRPWYFSAAGLVMGRDKPGRVWTTYETNNNPNQLMSTDDVDPDWAGGFETHVGRQFACGDWALDLTYWTLDDMSASVGQTHVNSVSTPLLFNDLEFGPGDRVQDYFDSAEEHRLARRNRVHNVELNLIEGISACGSCNTWQCRKSFGVRYFRFDDDLALATLDLGGVWGANSGSDEVYLEDSIENNLIGFQLGCQLERQCGGRLTFLLAPKFGIYNNHIEQRFDLRRGDGVAAMPSAFSGVSGGYPVESSRDVVSFLTELNLGLAWQPTCHWSLFGGYRVVALTGMGLADSQIPQYIIDIPEIADIDYQDALLLHGAFFGVSYSL